ncbi:MAG: rhodanese-like domain-containing protein [Myxococcales bacterium]|nr:rhodanese-like domain-containing protein [Deltaproteobacteria bacterium]NND29158.1 rhodanese-like domain-containing protein [Myxococcales bacterium]MBT8483271.1 rhodanese-like domain-containing protein [Deltaproteobacteria bacterium]NNK05728.1 rhodanese-like domain-containing protein [Myxococcales bacterium]NNK44366.1 rhodanese-like domain-containing protein [Myxococcales bacterium]
MRTIILSLLLTFVLAGCKDTNPSAAAEPASAEKSEPAMSVISVEDADKALQSGAVAVDANSEKTRKKNGTVPDAVILTSSYKYDLAQLPEDKSKDLIFYCSNTNCTASDAAAERASTNGYENVHIMREGIKGWKDAGKATKAYPQS